MRLVGDGADSRLQSIRRIVQLKACRFPYQAANSRKRVFHEGECHGWPLVKLFAHWSPRCSLSVAAELATIEKVKRAYYELYFIQQATTVTKAEQQLLGEIRDVANARYTTGQASQQDVLRADLEISNVENELIRLRQQLESGRARLARVLHVAPQTRLLPLDQLPPEEVPRDLDWLQRQAVAARPELHARLAAIQRDQQAVELARLDYKPDVTLGMS